MKPILRSGKTVVLTVFLLVNTGCGGSTGTITGKVSFQGKVVNAGSVLLLAEDGTRVSTRIRPDGTYRASLPVGFVKIAVNLSGPTDLPPIVVPRLPSKLVVKGHQEGPMVLPVYTDVDQSPLGCQVGRGVQTFEIDLP